jgi:hypothetical protein
VSTLPVPVMFNIPIIFGRAMLASVYRLGAMRREMNWAISRSASAPRMPRPSTTPIRSCSSRFWLIFHLPSSRVITMRKPTMPRNKASM